MSSKKERVRGNTLGGINMFCKKEASLNMSCYDNLLILKKVKSISIISMFFNNCTFMNC
jgi:hypothetical protein